MPLSEDAVIERTKELLEVRDADASRLDRIHAYITEDEPFHWLPRVVPEELRKLAKISRVNMLRFVVNSAVQNMYVEGYRAPRASDDAPSWEIWQRNRMDARQIGVHRAGIAYGASYTTVLPGDPVPVMRGASPRNMTVVYGNDDDWPRFALERRRNGLWRFFDEEAVYLLQMGSDASPEDVELLATEEHRAGVTPVIRYRETDDLDDEVVGIVEPLIDLQDQINATTFGLLVAQHYGAFRQRWVIGWMAETQEEKLKASASKLWTFEDAPDQVKVGEFGQTDLKGYLESREATLKALSTVSQTPAHELLGQLVNLSADALAAAEASQRRAITEYQTVMGESHEQSLGLGGQLMDEPVEPDPASYIRWKDTESRALGMLVDALGKAVQMLGIPPQALWDRVADAMGASQQEVEEWRREAERQAMQDPLADLIFGMNGSSPAPEPAGVSD